MNPLPPAPAWTCPGCKVTTREPCCPRCALPHGSADADCTWTNTPTDEDAGERMWITQECPHGLARFVTAS